MQLKLEQDPGLTTKMAILNMATLFGVSINWPSHDPLVTKRSGAEDGETVAEQGATDLQTRANMCFPCRYETWVSLSGSVTGW